MKFGIGLVPEEGCDLSAKHSVRAEKAGLDYVFMSDHLKGRNVHVCLTAVAYSTERILIGPGVTNPYLIHPVATAQILSSINEVAPSRVVCGLGAGDESNLRRVGVKQVKPVAAVREAVQIIRTILTGDTVDIDGEVFKISNERFGFPKADRLPILIGAQGDRMLRLAGEVGDGVIVNAADPVECERAIKIVRRSGEDAGRSMEGFEWAAAMPFSIAEEADDALKPLLPKVAVVAAGCDASVLERLEISLEDRERVREAVLRDDYDEMVRSVTQEMIDSLSIAGTPDTCIEKIGRLVKAGVTLMVLAPPLGPGIDEAIDMVAIEVLPRFG
ncbi:MAG: 5,10-methylenetetrahydromethanopterin reductase [Nitrososphaerales archaeon]